MSDRILIVEDHAIDAKLASILLEASGFEVATAATVREARAALIEFAPHLVLVDLRLPFSDGLDLVRAIRADPVRANTPIVAVTAYAMSDDEERARAAGCDDYIPKPIDTQTFAARVAASLDRRDEGLLETGLRRVRSRPPSKRTGG